MREALNPRVVGTCVPNVSQQIAAAPGLPDAGKRPHPAAAHVFDPIDRQPSPCAYGLNTPERCRADELDPVHCSASGATCRRRDRSSSTVSQGGRTWIIR